MKFLMIIICLLLTGCGDKKVDNLSDISKFKDEYENSTSSIKMDIDESVKLTYLNDSEAIDFLENKTGIIYFGFPNCPWCRNIVPVLLSLAKDNNVTVYYFNPSDLRKNNDENYEIIKNILDEYLEKNENGQKVLYVPDVYFVKDGNIKGHYLGSVSSQTDPYKPLSIEEKKELYNIYNNLYEQIKD